MSIRKLLLILLAQLFVSQAYGLNVIVVTSDGALSIAKSISSRLSDSIIVRSTDDPNIETASHIVTIGNDPFLQLIGKSRTPMLASFISYNVFHSVGPELRHDVKAVFIEPNPEQIGAQIQQIYSNTPTIGYIFGEDDHFYKAMSLVPGVRIIGRPFEHSTLWSLNSFYLAKKIDGFYIPENRNIFNQSNILLVLESLFRKRIPAITSNRSLIRKGSVLTIYASYDDISALTINIMQKLDQWSTLPSENFVRTEVVFDTRLAEKVGIEQRGAK